MITFLKSKTKWFFLILSLMAIGFYFSSSKSNRKLKLKNSGKVLREDLIQRVTIAGFVAPFRKSLITAPYSGYIKKIYVNTSDLVKQGDPIVSISQSLQSSDSPFPLRAPFSGTVVQVQKSDGEYVREGDMKEFIMRIDDLSKLFIIASAPEMDRTKIKVGQEVIIKASAILNRSYKGIIREISLAAREEDRWSRAQTVEFPIRVEMIDFDPMVKPGMTVIMDIVTDKKADVLTLRHEYIHREKDQYFVLMNNGKKRTIQVGMQNEEAFEITNGLNEGDLVQMVDFASINKVD